MQHLPGGRLPHDRHAVPPRRDGPVPRMPRDPVPPRSPRGHLPRPEHRRGPRADGPGSVRLLPPPSQGPGPAPPAPGHRPGLLEAGPAGVDSLGRRGAAAQAGGLLGRSLALLDAPPMRRTPSSCSTSRPPDSIRWISSSCSRPSTRLVDRGHSVVVISTAPRSCSPPTGSSTSAPAPATKGARSSRRGLPRRSRGARRRPGRSWHDRWATA